MRASRSRRGVEAVAAALDAELAADARHLAQHLDAKAVHHRHDDDQRADAQRDADQREAGDDRDEALLAAGAQIAQGDRGARRRRRPCCARLRLSRTAGRPGRTAASSRSPVLRFLSSALPAATPLGPTITCQGMPIRSMSANLAPGRCVAVVVAAPRCPWPCERVVELLAGAAHGAVVGLQVDDRRP